MSPAEIRAMHDIAKLVLADVPPPLPVTVPAAPAPAARPIVRARARKRVAAVRSRSRKGRVYFIEAVGTDRIKIGFTGGDPEQRLRGLQTSCPFPLRVTYSFEGTHRDERNLHKRFASTRVMPSAEWFYDTPALREFIAWLIEVST